MRDKNLAVIIARGGSKRIPRKNIKIFCGKPIITYSIEAALQSKIFDEIMVSTEDEEIRRVAEQNGAKVPFMRSEKNAGDMAMTHEVILEVLKSYKKRGESFNYLCCIYPTAPFITPNNLIQSYTLLKETNADTVLPIVKFSFPPQRCLVVEDNLAVYKWPEYHLSRSQDLEPLYHDCGQYYFLKTESFLKTKTIITKNTVPIIVSEMEVQDIDTNEDWKLAELKYQTLNYN